MPKGRLHLTRIARVAVVLAMTLTSTLVFAEPARAETITYCVPKYYLHTVYGYARPCTRKLDSGIARRGLHNRGTGEIYYSGGFIQAGTIFIRADITSTDGFYGTFHGTAVLRTPYGEASYGIHLGNGEGRFGWYNLEVRKFLPDSVEWLPLLVTGDDNDPHS